LTNTLGDLSCTRPDATECGITTVSMVENPTGGAGDFAAVFDNPIAIQKSAESIEDRFVTNNFKKSRIPLAIGDEIDFGDEDEIKEYLSRDGNINDFPWKNNFNGFGRRLQDNLLDPSVATYIANPVVCTTIGSAVIFENLAASTNDLVNSTSADNNNRYPVYVKDSLLNTN